MAAVNEKSPLLTQSGETTDDTANSTCVKELDDVVTYSESQGAAAAAEVQPGTAVVAMAEDSDSGSDTSQESSSASSPAAAQTNKKMHDLVAVMSAIKGNMGTGILAMPFAVSCAGLVVGPTMIFLMGCIALTCMHLLVKVRHIQLQRAEAEGRSMPDMGYADLLACSLRTAHPCFRGRPEVWARRFVNLLLMISQLGFCSVYIVFVADNIREAVEALTSTSLDIWTFQLMVAAPLAAYSQMRGLNKSSPFQIFANILTVFGLTIIFANFFSGKLPDVSSRPYFGGWSFMPTFFGTAVFSFEGISLILPLEKKVEDKRLYAATFGVVTLSLTVVICLYTTMGFYGFLVYGPLTRASITLNLPKTPWYNFSVKPVFAIVMFLSYQMQLHVPVSLVVDWLKDRYNWRGDETEKVTVRHRAEAVVRLCFFVITLVIAMAVPQLDLLISFVGAFASSFLALILPALIYLLTIVSPAQSQRPHPAKVVASLLVIALGLLGFVSGTYTSIVSLVELITK